MSIVRRYPGQCLHDVTDSVPFRSDWAGGLGEVYDQSYLRGADAGVNVTPSGVQVNTGISWLWLIGGFIALDALVFKKFLFKK